MSLALRIIGVVQIVALVVLGGPWQEALRQPSSDKIGDSRSNVLPFRSTADPSARAKAHDS